MTIVSVKTKTCPPNEDKIINDTDTYNSKYLYNILPAMYVGDNQLSIKW